ncbi:hypothetical protein IPL85_06070 [Candidatus Saccharibacteria bacterium]|nr:MAG: hypothetical protein IPL85_06070 [Candidatus Saccharibacteria bacterium]
MKRNDCGRVPFLPSFTECATVSLLSFTILLGSAACSAIPGASLFSRCDEPTAEDKAVVDALFAHPLPKFPQDKKESTQDSLWRLRKEAAAKNGLHVFDPRATLDRYSSNLYENNGKNIPLSDYQLMAKEFMARYGVSVIQPTDVTTYPLRGIVPLSSATITESDEFAIKQNYVTLVRSTAELPVELVNQIGLTEVIVVKIADKTILGRAETATKTKDFGRFYIDATKPTISATFHHEIFHLWDANQCTGRDGIYGDPSFTELNPDGAATYVGMLAYKAKAEANPSLTVENTSNSQAAKDVINEWQIASAKAVFTKEQNAFYTAKYNELFSKAIVHRDYALSDVAEDKAVNGEIILWPYYYNYGAHNNNYGALAPWSSVVRAKSLFLLTRMYQDDPRIVQYYNYVGNRQAE